MAAPLKTIDDTSSIPLVKLSNIAIDKEAISLVPPQLIKQYLVLPVRIYAGAIVAAMADPLDRQAINDIRLVTGLDLIPMLANENELRAAIHQYTTFYFDPPLQNLLEDLDVGQFNIAENDQGFVSLENEAPIIKLVDYILAQAVNGNCSDIHIEPQELQTRVRFRIDGTLHELISLPKSYEGLIISRIKIIAGMDIAEKRVPQDGRFKKTFDGRDIDFRVSSLPVSYGEKLVLRILDKEQAINRIEQLGLTPDNQQKVQSLSQELYGMILITGPTGSGKTTTLYSILHEINSAAKNIITLEDPIEYSLPGVNQVQVNAKTGFSFANGLKSVLRQDPDVIMLGEIRDSETARLAVQAALTGHLILATLHAKSAAGAIARLLDMGVEHFLIASALSGIVAQRLVRKLCPWCRTEYLLDNETARTINSALVGQTFYQPGGCNMCRQLGYIGRIALHEVMEVDANLKRAIIKGQTGDEEITGIAIKRGFKSLFEDGIEKARVGLTSLEEVIKAVYI